MVDLRISVDGGSSEALTGSWSALSVNLGVGYTQDTATLTVAAVGGIELPRKSAALGFVVDGANLGTFRAIEVGGSTRDGKIIIECAALDPEAAIRRPRDRQWEEQSLGSIVNLIASEAGLTPVVNSAIGGVQVSARTQTATSDIAFIQRLVESRTGRLLIQEGRLIVTSGDEAAAALPTLEIDLRAEGAWVDWRRGWSDVQQRVVAAYLLEDGSTMETVEVGSGDAVRRLPNVYPSADEAGAAARRYLVAGDVSRDRVEISTGLTPTAQVLQPLRMLGADDRIPVGFPPLVVHSVRHTLGRDVAQTALTARPAVA